MRPQLNLRRTSRAAVLAILLVGADGCATTPTGAPPPLPSQPIVLPDSRLCAGTPDDPRGERDPACAPDGTHERVDLVHHLAGCRAGLRGPAEFRLLAQGVDPTDPAAPSQLLATLRAGEKRALSLPRGDVVIAIDQDGHRETHALSLEGSGPVVLEVGCTSFVGGLVPLVLEGPHGPCPTDTVKVRAGGLDLRVGQDQFQTLFLPRGSHVVKIDGVERTIVLDGPMRLPLTTCGNASH